MTWFVFVAIFAMAGRVSVWAREFVLIARMFAVHKRYDQLCLQPQKMGTTLTAYIIHVHSSVVV
jgi:hypothetical protein